ncbi:hypothetical protein GCM10007158_04240 [Vreelandella hamiltonii]|uniref:Uncharacterized protein n=1 Tax=Halomonas johnsoniae TaxID=502832 RepID=A0ABQ2WD70_9GAMM|nr:hypothetical protein GCM10007158_04240 [Halomonas johnsoniae]
MLQRTTQAVYNKNDSLTSAPGVSAMPTTRSQANPDVMEVWATRALQQRAAFDALADYMRQQ